MASLLLLSIVDSHSPRKKNKTWNKLYLIPWFIFLRNSLRTSRTILFWFFSIFPLFSVLKILEIRYGVLPISGVFLKTENWIQHQGPLIMNVVKCFENNKKGLFTTQSDLTLNFYKENRKRYFLKMKPTTIW